MRGLPANHGLVEFDRRSELQARSAAGRRLIVAHADFVHNGFALAASNPTEAAEKM
jgi:hypothetical protein